MAFTTQQGTGGAPWTFLGTPEADSIAVITGDNFDSKAFDFIAEGFEGNDIINFNGVRSVTIKGGQGADLITNNLAIGAASSATLITTSFINGNDGDDTIGNSQFGLEATLSTVSGGQADDTIYVASLESSRANGNRGNDNIFVGEAAFTIGGTINAPLVGGVGVNLEAAFSLSSFNNAQIFGGQGEDFIEVVSTTRDFTSTTIAGQDGDDVIAVQIGQADFAGGISELVSDFTDGFINIDPFTVLSEPDFINSVISGGNGDDIIDASGLLVFDEIDETSTSDLVIEGNDGDDSAFGGIGSDLILGNDGDDWLAGYGDRDEIFGGKGDDVVIGAYYDGELSFGFVGDGAGDFLSGGTGSNRFYVPGSGAFFDQGGFGASNPLGSTLAIFVVPLPQPAANNGSIPEYDPLIGQAKFTIGDRTIDNGDLIVIPNAADVIIDWNAGAGNNVLDTGLANQLTVQLDVNGDPANPQTVMSLGAEYLEFGNFAVRGNYVERFNENGEFVVNEFGTDIAVWTNYEEPIFTSSSAGFDLSSEFFTVNNFTVLENVPTSVIVTANEFVAV